MRLYSGQDSNTGWQDERQVYDGLAVIEECSADGTVPLRRYYYEDGLHKPIAVEENLDGNGTVDGAADATYVVLTDDRGTVMGIADTAGNVIEKLFYNSTGLAKACSATGTPLENVYGTAEYSSRYVRVGWCGMHRDRFTGLYHTHFRDFDPLTNRWTSEDPAGYADGLNLYAAYFGVNGVDVLGLGDWSWAWNWHHKLPTEVFRGTDKTPAFVSSLGLTLSQDVDIDAAEYGRVMRGESHLGEGGVHPSGYNSEIKQKLREWRKRNPGVKVLTKAHVDDILESLAPEFKRLNQQGHKAYISKRQWDAAIRKFKANKFAQRMMVRTGLAGRSVRGARSAEAIRGKLRGFALPVLSFVAQIPGTIADELEARSYREALVLQQAVRGMSDEQIQRQVKLRERLEYGATPDVFGIPNPDYRPELERILEFIPDDEIVPDEMVPLLESLPDPRHDAGECI